MSHITQNIKKLRAEIPFDVKIVAISKTHSVKQIREAMESGHNIFGESRVQELIAKYKQISDVQWHMVGHLQTNKVKLIVPFVHMIQSVDSLRLIDEINKQAINHNRVIDCLLQVHIAREEAKFGFSEPELIKLIEKGAFENLKHVKICGLMGMATFTDDMNAVRLEFRRLNNFFKLLRKSYFCDNPFFTELSMGMSADYNIAIEEGATIIRPGSTIFAKKY